MKIINFIINCDNFNQVKFKEFVKIQCSEEDIDELFRIVSCVVNNTEFDKYLELLNNL